MGNCETKEAGVGSAGVSRVTSRWRSGHRGRSGPEGNAAEGGPIGRSSGLEMGGEERRNPFDLAWAQGFREDPSLARSQTSGPFLLTFEAFREAYEKRMEALPLGSICLSSSIQKPAVLRPE